MHDSSRRIKNIITLNFTQEPWFGKQWIACAPGANVTQFQCDGGVVRKVANSLRVGNFG